MVKSTRLTFWLCCRILMKKSLTMSIPVKTMTEVTAQFGHRQDEQTNMTCLGEVSPQNVLARRASKCGMNEARCLHSSTQTHEKSCCENMQVAHMDAAYANVPSNLNFPRGCRNYNCQNTGPQAGKLAILFTAALCSRMLPQKPQSGRCFALWWLLGC